VAACGICGSDLHSYKHGLYPLGAPISSGLVLGHEFGGVVAQIAGEVQGLNVGDRVSGICVGCAAQYVRLSALVIPAVRIIPPEISLEEAATIEPLANSVHAVHLAGLSDGQTAVVIGAGIIGLGVIQVLKAKHAVKVVAVDFSQKRLDVAVRIGADAVVNAAHEDAYQGVLRGTGASAVLYGDEPAGEVDAVFECAGAARGQRGPAALQQALRIVRENGKIVVVSIAERPVEIQAALLVRKGAAIIGSWAWTLDDFDEAIGLMTARKLYRRPLISHEFPIERAKEAYETALSEEESVKVLIKPWGEEKL
jgi:2-desacetyl-2-hydroxyethyl bacteriochlorophyllide A dehydrogenase